MLPRIPLAGQLVSAALGCPTALDAHPKHVTALGAAKAAARATQQHESTRAAETIGPLVPTPADGNEPRPRRPPPSLNTAGRLHAYRKIALITLSAALSLVTLWGTAHALTTSGHHHPNPVITTQAAANHSVVTGTPQQPVISAASPPMSAASPATAKESTPRASKARTSPSAPPATSSPPASPVTITLTPTALPDAGCSPYGQAITAAGGTAPYSFSISSGTLPPGLSLTSTGEISGTVVNGAGTFQFTVSVTDSSVTPNSGFQAYTLNAACIT